MSDKKETKKKSRLDDLKKSNDPRTPNSGMMRMFLFLMIGALIFSVYSVFSSSDKSEYQITYSEYQQFLHQDIILKAKIYKESVNDFKFVGVLKQPIQMNIDGTNREVQRFSVKIAVIDSAIEKEWADSGITWEYIDGNQTFWNIFWSIIPWILIFGVYIFFMRWMTKGGGMGAGGGKGVFSFGKSKAKLNENTNITFADVAGVEEAKVELSEVVDFLKSPEKYNKLGGKIPKGVLLLGSPGTGKTLLARAVAGEAEVPFFSISGADFVEMFVGVGASRVRDLFENAKKQAPCIVFIDEIDAVGRQRGAGLGGGHDEREQTLNQLLVEMDGFEQNSGVIVVAATNRSDVLDSALLRPGRFDRHIVVDRPDIRGREGIFKVHCAKIKVGEDVNMEVLAKGTPGLVGADIANIVNEAALLAARRGADVVTMYDFENAKDKVLMGVERKSLILTDKEKEMTAYHEMGHALVGRFLPNSDPVHKITIIPRGQALGLTAYLPQEEMRSHTREYIITNITMMLGGRAAEKIIYDNLTTGASNDIKRATYLATKMVCEWGMSEKIGPVAISTEEENVFLGREITRNKAHSEKMAQAVDEEVKHILDECSHKAINVLNEHIELLHKSSKILVERETIEGEELNLLIEGKELEPISKMKLEALKSVNNNTEKDNIIDEIIDDSETKTTETKKEEETK